MSEKYRLTLQDGDKKCEMDFLTLEYLQRYDSSIDITKIKIHDILGNKLYFIYDGAHISCPLYQYDILAKAMADYKIFMSQIFASLNITQ